MAEEAHCYYCFDVLVSDLSRPKRKPLSLHTIERTLEAYKAAQWTSTNTVPNGSLNGETNGVLTNGTTSATNGVNGTSNSNGFSNGTGGNSSASNGKSYANATRPTKPEHPLFVTWSTIKGSSKHLRGCIGTFEPHELEEGLKSYALTSAFDDQRFNPIDQKELSSLECGVSILTDFEPASDAFDWTLGIHGLRISFTYHSRRLGATYLPDVPLEQGWTQEETLVSLMRKAGWSGRRAEWRKVSDLKVIRYKGTKSSVEWGDYKKLMEWRESHLKEIGESADDE